MQTVLVIAAFVIGFSYGNEKSKPTLNPVKAIKEKKIIFTPFISSIYILHFVSYIYLTPPLSK